MLGNDVNQRKLEAAMNELTATIERYGSTGEKRKTDAIHMLSDIMAAHVIATRELVVSHALAAAELYDAVADSRESVTKLAHQVAALRDAVAVLRYEA